jgi:hypothetical protein
MKLPVQLVVWKHVSDRCPAPLQAMLVLIPLAAVPIMLLPKPLTVNQRFQKGQADLAQ